MKEGWVYKTLGECCDILDSKRKPITKNKRIEGDIPYYGATGILDYVKEYIFDEKLVLIGEDGAKWGAGENTAYIIYGKSWVNNHAHAIRPNRQCIIDEFLVFYLNYSDLSDKITGVTVPKLNQEKMRGIILPIPSVSDQQRIVTYLDAEFAKIEALKANAEKQLQAAKDLFQAALKELLTPKEGWEEKKLGEVITHLRTGLNPRTHFKLNTPDATYNYITVRELKGFSIVTDDKTDKVNAEALNRINKRSNLLKGDVLFSGTGTIGNTALVTEQPDTWNIKEGIYALTPNHKVINSKFLIYVISSDFFLNKAKKMAEGTGVKSIPMKRLVELPIHIPNIDHQEKYVDRLDALSANVKALQSNYTETITLCNDLKQALLKQVFG